MECQLRFRQQNQLVPSILVDRSACLRSCSCETSLPVHPRRSPCPSQAYVVADIRGKLKPETAWQASPHPTQAMRSHPRGILVR